MPFVTGEDLDPRQVQSPSHKGIRPSRHAHNTKPIGGSGLRAGMCQEVLRTKGDYLGRSHRVSGGRPLLVRRRRWSRALPRLTTSVAVNSCDVCSGGVGYRWLIAATTTRPRTSSRYRSSMSRTSSSMAEPRGLRVGFVPDVVLDSARPKLPTLAVQIRAGTDQRTNAQFG